jgi:hypothetical protein
LLCFGKLGSARDDSDTALWGRRERETQGTDPESILYFQPFHHPPMLLLLLLQLFLHGRFDARFFEEGQLVLVFRLRAEREVVTGAGGRVMEERESGEGREG